MDFQDNGRQAVVVFARNASAQRLHPDGFAAFETVAEQPRLRGAAAARQE